MSTPAPRRSSMTPRMVGWIVGMIAVFAFIYISLPKKSGTSQNSGQKSVTTTVNRSQCEARLAKWLQSVDPLRHQFDTDIEGRIAELNRYWETCGPKAEEPIVTDLKAIEAALSETSRGLALGKRFSRRDAQHIRQSILLSRIAVRIAEGKKTERERVMATMVLISQQVEPVPQSAATDSPLTPFESLLIGKGTASDRAWIFAEILRQLGIDCVIFVNPDPQATPLVGAIVDQDILLFDPLTGFAVPAAGESSRKSMFQEPARLADAIADDAILRQLDVEGSHLPWTSQSLKSAALRVVGTTCTWSPRMAELQFQWTGADKCVLYDGLGASAIQDRSLLTRVQDAVAGVGFSKDQVKVWDYPEQRAAQYAALGEETAPHMKAIVEIMSGPTVVEGVTNKSTGARELLTYRSKQPLQMIRAQQLIGNRVEAVQGYLPLTRSHRAPTGFTISGDTQQLLDQNRDVADRATYWLASTQYENNDIPACVDTLRRYRRDFALGEMTEASLMRLAACLVRAGDNAGALEVLKALGPGPNQWRRALLVRRLEQLVTAGEQAPPAEPGKEESAPASQKSETPPTSPDSSAKPDGTP